LGRFSELNIDFSLQSMLYGAGTVLTLYPAKTPVMKLDFGFYFRMLICTGVLCALVYGLGSKAVEQHAPLTFGMLSAVMVGIGGMIKHLPSASEGTR
jgi:hypothetical protein